MKTELSAQTKRSCTSSGCTVHGGSKGIRHFVLDSIGIVKDCQGLSGIVRGCQGLSGIVRDCQGLSGIDRGCHGLLGIVRDC